MSNLMAFYEATRLKCQLLCKMMRRNINQFPKGKSLYFGIIYINGKKLLKIKSNTQLVNIENDGRCEICYQNVQKSTALVSTANVKI